MNIGVRLDLTHRLLFIPTNTKFAWILKETTRKSFRGTIEILLTHKHFIDFYIYVTYMLLIAFKIKIFRHFYIFSVTNIIWSIPVNFKVIINKRKVFGSPFNLKILEAH